MTPVRHRRAPSAVVFAATLVGALLATGFQGLTYYRDHTPAPAVQARVGEPVQLGGTRLAVQSFTVAPQLPPDDPKQTGKPPVRGPAGSLLVLIVYTQQVDATVNPDGHVCDASLVADDGTIWEEDDDFGYQLSRPVALSCGSTDDQPLEVGAIREIGASYLIPARYADQVRWRLSVPDADQPAGYQAAEFHR